MGGRAALQAPRAQKGWWHTVKRPTKVYLLFQQALVWRSRRGHISLSIFSKWGQKDSGADASRLG
jgi:hypothetical protein